MVYTSSTNLVDPDKNLCLQKLMAPPCDTEFCRCPTSACLSVTEQEREREEKEHDETKRPPSLRGLIVVMCTKQSMPIHLV